MMVRLPEWMPIVDAHMQGARFPLKYEEPEIIAPIELCDEDGLLNATTRGWARQPIVRANLSGHWPRKKRWNFWNWIGPRFVFSVTLANIDYAAFCAFFFIDFESGEKTESFWPAWPRTLRMPEHVERPVRFAGRNCTYDNGNNGGDFEVRFNARDKNGVAVNAEFVVRKPPGNESLTVIVPWTRERFQMNCKENTRPCEGSVTVGGKRYAMNDCHAVQDFGRGMWPYRAFWNWGVASGTQDGRRIGINVGAKWTTGTGANENALCIDGRLHKIMEDLIWEYDAGAPMQAWQVRSTHSDAVDLTFQPRIEHRSSLNVGVLASGGVCVFGRWSGTISAGGERLRVADLPGWAEEFSHRW